MSVLKIMTSTTNTALSVSSLRTFGDGTPKMTRESISG
jgi:hypothetical protein